MTIGLWFWDIAADEVQGDPVLNEMFGLPPVSSQQRPVAEYLQGVHPDDRSSVWTAIGQAIAEGGGEHYEAEYRLIAGGQERWVRAHGVVKRNQYGKATYLSGMVADLVYPTKRLD